MRKCCDCCIERFNEQRRLINELERKNAGLNKMIDFKRDEIASLKSSWRHAYWSLYQDFKTHAPLFADA